MKYPLHRPVIGEGEIDAVVDVLRSGNLVYGKHSRHLEQEVAEHFGFKHGVAVSSGTNFASGGAMSFDATTSISL